MRRLTANEIDVKVKQVTAKGALLLLYKTARVDMQMLDEEFGADNWQCDYKTINGVLYCGIGVFKNNQWVWKWDCGIESREDEEGNQKKGEASDAFKRAGFKWGIGRELYTAPFTWANVPTKQNQRGKWELANPFMRFVVDEIDYDKEGNISKLKIKSDKGEDIFSYGKGASKPAPKATTRQEAKKEENKQTFLLQSEHIIRMNNCMTVPDLDDCILKIKAEMGENFEAFRAEFTKQYTRRKEEIMKETAGFGV